MSTASDLETLLPTAETVAISEGSESSETITLTPFRWKQFKEVTELVKGLSLPMKATEVLEPESGEMVTVQEIDYLALVSNHGDVITKIIAIGAGKPEIWVNNLELTDIVPLAAGIIKVNKDFFFQRLAPKLRELVGKLSAGQN